MIDNYDLWCEHDARQTEALARMPVCECCGEHIQTDKALFHDGKWFCTDRECEKEFIDMVWEDIKNDYLFDVREI